MMILHHPVELWGHPHCLILNFLFFIKGTALSISSDFLSLLLLSTGAPDLFAVSVHLPYVNIK